MRDRHAPGTEAEKARAPRYRVRHCGGFMGLQWQVVTAGVPEQSGQTCSTCLHWPARASGTVFCTGSSPPYRLFLFVFV